MGLTIGSRLGPYEIISAIGAGGMGEVYRATDTSLGRQVAIKVLPDAFAQDVERLARFEREAKTLASLNHPHIAQIYGLEKSRGVQALVMELVEGEDLSQRISRGAIPLDEALPIAKQIAEALEAAHERGIIHRDLKPANIKVTSDGTVKVLDFGLAKLSESVGSGQSAVGGGPLSLSPTITSPALMTGVGVILGTAAYMSPEQAKGREADRRSDVWAFGCVLYEMLTGRRPFDGEDVSDTFANVLKIDPDWTKLPAHVPSTIVTLLKGCLEKNRAQRISDAAVVRFLLNQPGISVTGDSKASPPSLQSRLGWAIAALALAGLAIVSWLHVREQPVDRPLVHLSVPLIGDVAPGWVALSPDGRNLLLTQTAAGIVVRPLDGGETRTLTGTIGARTPFWSPDSRTIAFFNEGALKTVPASGGPPQRLCGDTGLGAGGTWNNNGVILFVTEAGALRRVPGGGGECADVSKAVPGEQRARLPVFLPDGDHFLYSRQTGVGRREVFVASLGEPDGRRLLPDLSSADFVPDQPGANTGYVLFVREGTLMAQRFDATSLELSGEPLAIASQVGTTPTPPQIAASASASGTVVFVANGRPDRRVVWYDRTGKEMGQVAGAGAGGGSVAIAPNGRWVAYARTDTQNILEARLFDVERQQDARFFALPLSSVVWSPDAARVAFSGVVAATTGIHIRNVSGGSDQLLLREGISRRAPSDWSHDGRWIVYTENNEQTRGDIWMVPASAGTSDVKPIPLLRTPANESQGQISADGRWIVYSSDESGIDQAYVRPFVLGDLSQGPVWMLPSASAREPRWRPDGKEIFYLERIPGTGRVKIMSVAVTASPNPLGLAKQLFEIPISLAVPQNNSYSYAPSADGERFLVLTTPADARPSIDVLLNWAANAARRNR